MTPAFQKVCQYVYYSNIDTYSQLFWKLSFLIYFLFLSFSFSNPFPCILAELSPGVLVSFSESNQNGNLLVLETLLGELDNAILGFKLSIPGMGETSFLFKYFKMASLVCCFLLFSANGAFLRFPLYILHPLVVSCKIPCYLDVCCSFLCSHLCCN